MMKLVSPNLGVSVASLGIIKTPLLETDRREGRKSFAFCRYAEIVHADGGRTVGL
jgi:hypothetical protein